MTRRADMAYMVPVGRAAAAHLKPKSEWKRSVHGDEWLEREVLGVLPTGEEVVHFCSNLRPGLERRAELVERLTSAWMPVEAERQILAGLADRGDVETQSPRDRGNQAWALARAMGQDRVRSSQIAVSVEHRADARRTRQRAELYAIARLVHIAGPVRPYPDRFQIYGRPQFAQWMGRVELRPGGTWSVTWTLLGRYDSRQGPAEAQIGGRIGQDPRGGARVPEAALLRAVSKAVAEGLWGIWRGLA